MTAPFICRIARKLACAFRRVRRKERILDRMIAVEREIVNLEQVIEVTRGRHSKGAPMLRKRLVALRAEFMALAMEYEGIAR